MRCYELSQRRASRLVGTALKTVQGMRMLDYPESVRSHQRGVALPTREGFIVVDLAASISDASKNGERRTIHRHPYRRVKPIPKRPSMLDPPLRRDRGVARRPVRDDGGRGAGSVHGAPAGPFHRHPPAHHAENGEGVEGEAGEKNDPARRDRR